MKIEIGKSYEITASWKKSLYEIEMFKHKDGRALNTEICWRNGTFIVHIENEIEQLDLQDCVYDEETNNEPDDWDYESYNNVELYMTIFTRNSIHFDLDSLYPSSLSCR